jgi:hypothetical protein
MGIKASPAKLKVFPHVYQFPLHPVHLIAWLPGCLIAERMVGMGVLEAML